MKINKKEFVPFGFEWEIEMAKWDKKSLIAYLRDKLKQIQDIESNEILREFMMRANYAFPQSEEDINYFNEGLNPKMMERFLESAGLSLEEIKVPNQGWDEMSVAQPEFVKRKAYNENKLKL